MPTSVSPPEVVWLVAALVGFVLTAVLLIDAIGDVRASQTGNGIRQTIARGRVHAEAWGLVAQTLLLGMAIRSADSGVGARLIPENLTALAFFRVEYVLSIVSVAMMVSSCVSFITKHRVKRAIELEGGPP